MKKEGEILKEVLSASNTEGTTEALHNYDIIPLLHSDVIIKINYYLLKLKTKLLLTILYRYIDNIISFQFHNPCFNVTMTTIFIINVVLYNFFLFTKLTVSVFAMVTMVGMVTKIVNLFVTNSTNY